jgi:hypothetical protein
MAEIGVASFTSHEVNQPVQRPILISLTLIRAPAAVVGFSIVMSAQLQVNQGAELTV